MRLSKAARMDAKDVEGLWLPLEADYSISIGSRIVNMVQDEA